jgi:hypothetical protein
VLSRIPGRDPNPAVVARNEAGLPLGALLRNDKEVIRLPAAPPARSALQVGRHRLDPRYELLRPGPPRNGLARLPCAARRRRLVRAGAVQEPPRMGECGDGRPGVFGRESIIYVGFYLGDGPYFSEHGSAGTVVRGM